MTGVETEGDINDVCVVPNSGVIIMATERPKMECFYIPLLGPAPSWASYLDNLTEELEEKPQMSLYDDYKFVTIHELQRFLSNPSEP